MFKTFNKNKSIKGTEKFNLSKNEVYGWLLKVEDNIYQNLLTISNKKQILFWMHIISDLKVYGNNFFCLDPKKYISFDDLSYKDLLNINSFILKTKRFYKDRELELTNHLIYNNLKILNDIFSIGNICLDYEFFNDRIKFINFWEKISDGKIFNRTNFNYYQFHSISSWIIFLIEENIKNYYFGKIELNIKIKDYYLKKSIINTNENYSKKLLIDYAYLAYNKILDLKPFNLLIKYNQNGYIFKISEDFLLYKLMYDLNKVKDIKKILQMALEESIIHINKYSVNKLIDLFYIPNLNDYYGFQNIILRYSIIKYYNFIFCNNKSESNDKSTQCFDTNSKNHLKSSFKNEDDNNSSYVDSKIFKSDFTINYKKKVKKTDLINFSKDYFFKTFNAQLNNMILKNNKDNNRIDIYKTKIINRVKHLLENTFKNKTAIIFGSHFYNIKEKNSDIDIMIVNKNNDKITNQIEFLKIVNNLFKEQGFILESKSIFNAKIPLIKLKASLNHDYIIENKFFNLNKFEKNDFIKQLVFSIDICCSQYDSDNNVPIGLRSSLFIKKHTNNNQILRETLLIIKIIFSKFNLNNSYKGGMNTYVLTILLITFDKISKISEKDYLKNIIQFFSFLSNFQHNIYLIDLGFKLENNEIFNIFKLKSNLNEDLIIFDPTLNSQKNISNCFNFSKIKENLIQWLNQYDKILKEINNKLIYDAKIDDFKEIKDFYSNSINKIDLINEIFN